jgi:hypothetical protein
LDNNAKITEAGSGADSIMPEEPDCVHLSEQYRCNLLLVKKCIGAECRFCQSSYERGRSYKKWQDVMNTMPDDKQLAISAAYYNGQMPWKDSAVDLQ